ncbi:hypothetical protein [Aquimarina macrocephali]|uniref:hypothetical protein n=1 Tax=Aquimarina macrocephali TaxID=666563 RepID=UPI003F6664F0
MKKFQKINLEKFNPISEDKLRSITGGSKEIELCNIRDSVQGDGSTDIDAEIDSE